MMQQAIPVLRTSDTDQALAWYARMGFEKEWEHRFESELPAFVSIARGEVRLFLSEHEGDAPALALVYLRMEDVASVGKIYNAEVIQQPWRATEVELRDPDGNRIRVGWPTA